ncbi:MAG: tyrosine-type recombinase/integrase [Candidatus Bathyarchaeia archaeon]
MISENCVPPVPDVPTFENKRSKTGKNTIVKKSVLNGIVEKPSTPSTSGTQSALVCPECGSTRVFKDGFRKAPSNASSPEPIQRFRCADYGHRFSEHLVLNTVQDNKESNHLSASGAKKMVSTTELKTVAEMERTPTENELRAAPQIEKLLIQLKNDGRKPGTVKNYRKMFNRLLKEKADLFNPENVKSILADLPNKPRAKKNMVSMLDQWFQLNEIKWRRPTYTGESEKPHIATEQQLDILITALGKKTATYCQLLKDTGARPGELSAVTWESFNYQMKTVRISAAEKGSNSRILPITAKTIEMLANLPQRKGRLFANADDMRSNFFLQRRRIAKEKATPEILLISFKTFRHWKGTMIQHLTHNPWDVKLQLGHKSIKSTETYIDIEKMVFMSQDDGKFDVKIADTLDDAVKLLEVGFEYHCEVEGHKIFRKRK